MREQLNSNPLVQVAVIAVLLLGAGFFFLSTMGGGEEEDKSAETTTSSSATLTTPEGSATVEATATAPVEGAAPATPSAVPPLPPGAASAAPPLPHAVTSAFHSGRTVALLFVRNGGIDDALVKEAVASLEGLDDVSVFVVQANHIADYAAIAEGVAVDRVPALVVLRPKRRNHGIPAASVSYGFQSVQSVVQTVVDAGYKGRTLDYHP
jgi:hypothetical protein